MLFSNRVNSWLKDRKERTEINIKQWGPLEENTFLLLKCFCLRLFFLTIPKSLKQYTLFKKDDPFHSYRRKLVYVLFRSWGVLFRLTTSAEWLRYFNDLAVGETAAPACFSRENAEGAGMPPLLSH
jgi:hypothetical protein